VRQALIADVHLTDDPRDEYRWGLFPWLAQQVWDELYILGDLTDKKDHHSAGLVNRLVEALVLLTDGGRRDIHIIKGNHDCVDPFTPFFGFLKHIPGIHYFSTPISRGGNGGPSFAILPFMPNVDSPWEGWPSADIGLFHGTVIGSLTENGTAMQSGVPEHVFKRFGKVWAGDIHVPQKIGNVEYVGAPYHVRFGDSFQPRVVLLNNWADPIDAHFPAVPKKLVVLRSGLDLFELQALPPGSLVKVRVELRPQDDGKWNQIKEQIQMVADASRLNLMGLELVAAPRQAPSMPQAEEIYGPLSDTTLVKAYAEEEQLTPQVTQVGLEVVETVNAH
jgi:hypothetical protein